MRQLRRFTPLLTLAMILSVLTVPAAFAADGDTHVFINELHYDNSGTDAGEAIEIAGPVGTDLTGWSVVLYNGNGGAMYDTIALSGVLADDTGSGFGFTVATPTSGIQNGAPDGLALVDGGGNTVQFLSYEGSFAATDGPANGTTSTDIGVAEDFATTTAEIGESVQLTGGPGDGYEDFSWTAPAASTFGAANNGQTFEVGASGSGGGGATPVLISDIQGSGSSSPLAGSNVEVTAIVTSLFEDDDAVEGFFLEEEDSDQDADASTSEGLLVFCDTNCPALLAEGDQVTVDGQAEEFFGMTQIDAAAGTVTIDSVANPLPTAVSVDLPAGSSEAEDTYETTEGMIVTFPDTLVVSEYFELARFGQIVLTVDARPFQFTHDNAPSEAGYAAFLDDLETRRITLADNNDDQNDAISGASDEPYAYPEPGLSITNFFRGGDSVTDLTGVFHWSFGSWKVRPIESETYTFAKDDPRPVAPDAVGGDLRVASLNVLNYFTTIDDGVNKCPDDSVSTGDAGCRGADSEDERQRQLDKIVSALQGIDGDIVGLVEVENNESASLESIVDALNAATADGTYDYIDTGSIGTDAIKVGLIYQVDAVSPVGAFKILDTSVDARFKDDKNRPALIQTFADNDGARLTVAVNHLKSKGSDCDEYEDESIEDGQANCSETRDQAAQALADYLATDPTGSNDPDALIIGDLNAYRMEDAITSLESAGYTDLIERFVGEDAYSFVFDGQLGYLDHALANTSLNGQVTGATEWHINADEVPLFDYNDGVRDASERSFERESDALPIYAPDAYRASDHDAVILGLDLAQGEEGNTTRLSGEDRFATAVQVSQDSYPERQSASAVVLARADDPNGFADALAGTPLAVQEDAPLLITVPDQLLTDIEIEIERVLAPGRTVYLLGQEAALSAEVEARVTSLGYRVVRVGGQDRFETATLIADRLDAPTGYLITTAFNFPDALTAGAAAAESNAAVLLTQGDAKNATTEAYLARNPLALRFAIGGPAVNPYAQEYRDDADPRTEAVFGQGRMETAVAVAERFFTQPTVVGIARSDKFPDSLTGGAHIAAQGGPVLLTPTDALHPAPSEYLCEQSITVDEAFIYGGEAAISTATEASVGERIRGQGC